MPLSGIALIGIFRVLEVNVSPYITTAAHRRAGWHAACWTSDGIKSDWERNSKIRARPPVRNEHTRTGFEAILFIAKYEACEQPVV